MPSASYNFSPNPSKSISVPNQPISRAPFYPTPCFLHRMFDGGNYGLLLARLRDIIEAHLVLVALITIYGVDDHIHQLIPVLALGEYPMKPVGSTQRFIAQRNLERKFAHSDGSQQWILPAQSRTQIVLLLLY